VSFGSQTLRRIGRVLLRIFFFGLELAAACVLCIVARTFLDGHRSEVPQGEVRVAGAQKGVPELAFACELSADQLEALFSKPEVIDALKRANAAISVSLIDLGPERANVVRRLNQSGIPVTAWMALPKEQGYYLNAANAPQATARFAEFERWTSTNGLRWARIGLDIEPSLQDFGLLREGHWLRFLAAMGRRCFDLGRVQRARLAYSVLIGRMQAAGYPVETYQFPFIADARRVHSEILERLFGIVDVRGDREVFMTYSSFNRAIDSALVWAYGPDAQVLAVGSTAGDADPGGRFAPLNWNDFTRDAVVASHFSPVVGVYSLEGCVRQGFLPRLGTIDWQQTVTVPAEAVRQVMQLRSRIQAVLWTASHLPYLFGVLLIGNIWLIWRRRGRPVTQPPPHPGNISRTAG